MVNAEVGVETAVVGDFVLMASSVLSVGPVEVLSFANTTGIDTGANNVMVKAAVNIEPINLAA
jgi:hypothetical protein